MWNSILYAQKMISNKWQNCFIEKESFYTALFLRKTGQCSELDDLSSYARCVVR